MSNDNDLIGAVITSLISASTGVFGFVFGRRKYKVDVLNSELENIKGQFSVFNDNYKRLEEINAELRAENEQLRKDNTLMKGELDRLEKEVKFMRSELTSLGSENQSLRIKLNQYENQV